MVIVYGLLFLKQWIASIDARPKHIIASRFSRNILSLLITPLCG
jgi:hypothetical protein